MFIPIKHSYQFIFFIDYTFYNIVILQTNESNYRSQLSLHSHFCFHVQRWLKQCYLHPFIVFGNHARQWLSLPTPMMPCRGQNCCYGLRWRQPNNERTKLVANGVLLYVGPRRPSEDVLYGVPLPPLCPLSFYNRTLLLFSPAFSLRFSVFWCGLGCFLTFQNLSFLCL